MDKAVINLSKGNKTQRKNTKKCNITYRNSKDLSFYNVTLRTTLWQCIFKMRGKKSLERYSLQN